MTRNILHIWDTGGVASVLSKYLVKKYPVKSTVVSISRLDPFNITTFYGGQHYPSSTLTTIRFIMKGYSCDIIHVHSAYRFVRYFKRLTPNKAVIMHFHGEDVRLTGWNNLKGITEKADITLVSTPDLLEGAPQNVFWLPNPVDIEHFKPMPSLRKAGTALYFVKHQRGENIVWPKNVAKNLGLELCVVDRKANPISYAKLPHFLNTFEYYIDQNWIHSLSKTALEALACGLKVVKWDGRVIEKLPEEHNPIRVIEKLWAFYQQAIG